MQMFHPSLHEAPQKHVHKTMRMYKCCLKAMPGNSLRLLPRVLRRKCPTPLAPNLTTGLYYFKVALLTMEIEARKFSCNSSCSRGPNWVHNVPE